MVKLKINGQERNWDGDPDLPLLWFLRDEAGLIGHEIWLWPGAVRRMHRHRRQAGGPRLHHLGFRRGRPRGHDHRRPSSDRRSPGSEGLASVQCPAMRLLPGRPDHAGRRAADGKSQTQSRPDPRSDGGQHLPLRLLPAHRKRGPSRIDGGVIMNILTNPKKLRGFERHLKVDNVSRRSILKGLGIAGGFVLAAPVMSRPAFAAYKTGAGKMPHGTVVDPARVRLDRARRHRHHRRPPRRDGNRRADQPAADRRRGDGSRLVARPGPAGARRRGQIRQPGYRRLAQHAALSDADAPDRRLGAHDAGGRRRQALGRAGDRGEGPQSRGGPQLRADAGSALATLPPMPPRSRCRVSKA